MFERRTRDPFPTRNIIALSAIVLLVLLFMLKQLKKAETTPTGKPEPIIIESAE